jgi:hypothetical protein
LDEWGKCYIGQCFKGEALIYPKNGCSSQNKGANQPSRIRKAMKYAYLYNIIAAFIVSIIISSIRKITIFF